MPASNTFYLASKSPRRKEILEQLGFRPVILASNDHTLRNFQGDEVQLPGEAPEDYVVRIAQEKALIAFEKFNTKSVLSCRFCLPIPQSSLKDKYLASLMTRNKPRHS